MTGKEAEPELKASKYKPGVAFARSSVVVMLAASICSAVKVVIETGTF
jgi:hypothetical protein